MTGSLDALLDLWRKPVEARSDPLADFAEVYADPVTVNGQPMPLTDLLDRAKAVQRAFSDLDMRIVQHVEAQDV
jgi:hypothetical protein